MRFGTLPVDEAEGAILAHSARSNGVLFKKGRKLSADDVAKLRAAGASTVIGALLEDDDVAEDRAAEELAIAVAGASVRVAEAFTGRVNLFADSHGVLVLDSARIDRLNAHDEAITVATLPPFAVVEPGQMLATVKIIPFAVPRSALDSCLDIAGNRALLRVAPFRPLAARLIQTRLAGTSPKMLDKTVEVTRSRIEALGGALLGETRCAHEQGALADAIRAAGPADILLIAGASAITDRRDVLPASIEAAGGRVHQFGMPVDPGNLLLLAELDGRPVLGLPGCARSPKLNGFDWVLQRLAAGIEVTPADVRRMGVGGLLMEIATRPQPREPKPAAPHAPRVGAIVLAAGRSSRMVDRNKLFIEVDGRAMLRHAVDAALGAHLSPVVVVTGHQREQAEATVAGLPVKTVHNPDYAEGLSTSLRAGLDALGDGVDAAIVCLGDMPRITARHLGRLAAAYNPVEGRALVVPTRRGKRGNPVLWDRRFFAAMRTLAGDVGARHLIGEHADELVEVEMDDDATLLDVDTPEALAALESAGA